MNGKPRRTEEYGFLKRESLASKTGRNMTFCGREGKCLVTVKGVDQPIGPIMATPPTREVFT